VSKEVVGKCEYRVWGRFRAGCVSGHGKAVYGNRGLGFGVGVDGLGENIARLAMFRFPRVFVWKLPKLSGRETEGGEGAAAGMGIEERT
jgi:hypothetical protein